MSSFWKLGFVFVVLANPLRHKIAAVPGLAVVALLLSGMISPAYAQVYSQIFTPSGTNSYVLFHGDPAYTVQNVDGPGAGNGTGGDTGGKRRPRKRSGPRRVHRYVLRERELLNPAERQPQRQPILPGREHAQSVAQRQ